MKEVSRFNFAGESLQAFEDRDGKIWLVGKEVCKLLGYTNVSGTISRHCKDRTEYTQVKSPNGSMSATRLISEPDLYRLAMYSKQPEARKFADWVENKLLPTIAISGMYFTEEMLAKVTEDPQVLVDLIKNRPDQAGNSDPNVVLDFIRKIRKSNS